MTPFLYHLAGDVYTWRRCKHRVLLEAGPFLVIAARCGRGLPDPAVPWPDGAEPKVRQIPRAAVDVPQGRHPTHDWHSSPPPLPKRASRPARPNPAPWTDEQRQRVRDLLSGAPRELDAALLGVPWPCDAPAVRRAFRRLALTTHPDRGGDPAAFRVLAEARDRLLESMEARP